MQLVLIKIIEKIKAMRVPEDIFFLQSEIESITECKKQLKKSLRELGLSFHNWK